ncbi:MAG: hypothetical protein JRJ59_00620 [Deltaproteobacteria bacterium]|nr:hypothetical protein [Deltaproteobacteria bacterium]
MVDRISPTQLPAVDKAQTSQAQSKEHFGRLLDKAMDNSGPTPADLEPAAPSAVPELFLKNAPEPTARVDQTLDLMDRLTKSLVDPQATPKTMAPLIESLNQQAEELISVAKKLSAQDQARHILEQTATVAKVQVAKFERGDFV